MEILEERKLDAALSDRTCVTIDNPEGDWSAYLRTCEISGAIHAVRNVDLLSARRCRALAYLGRRAQNEGAVYHKTEPRIFTPQFVRELAEENSVRRFKRYPWLERLLSLVAEIENMQDKISIKGKILRFSRLKSDQETCT